MRVPSAGDTFRRAELGASLSPGKRSSLSRLSLTGALLRILAPAARLQRAVEHAAEARAERVRDAVCGGSGSIGGGEESGWLGGRAEAGRRGNLISSAACSNSSQQQKCPAP